MVWGFGSKKKTPAEIAEEKRNKENERQKKILDKEFE